MVLTGSEVKSLRRRDVSMEEAYARIEKDELWLIGCHIAPYPFAGVRNHEPLRRRKLLVHRRQLAVLKAAVEREGSTLIPLRMYFNERGIAKLTLAVARGLRRADKREVIRAREHKREMDRAMRRRP
jgi:SsrA-binding protein